MAKVRTSSSTEVLLQLRRDSDEPLHLQLERQLREGIRSGRLPCASVLPSTRALATELGLSRGVVVESYEQLAAEGYVVTRPGGVTRVADSIVGDQPRRLGPLSPTARIDIDLRPGRPDLTLFPRAAWLRSVRRVLNHAPSQRLGYLDGRGVPELRDALASYLNRVRCTAAQPEDVVITSGFTQGLALVVRVLSASGVRRIGVEDPCLGESRRVIEDAGLVAIGIPVDDSGIRTDALGEADVDAVLVTPAHQYPTGAVLASDRRAELLAWAADRERLVIEDDYDAEFRYDRQPIGALQGLAPQRVIYAGTASKVLAPGLRLGWLVLPPSMVKGVADAKQQTDLGSPALDQLTFADFIARGELGRHLRRIRPVYRGRRDALLVGLRRYLPALEPVGASAGLHVLAWLPMSLDPAGVADAAAAAGIGIAVVPRVRAAPGGVIFGYAAASDESIGEGLRRLAEVIGRMPDGRALEAPAPEAR